MSAKNKPTVVRMISLLLPSALLGISAAYGISVMMDAWTLEYRRDQARQRSLSFEDEVPISGADLAD